MDVNYFAFDPGYSILFGKLAQVPGITRGIDMVGITQRILLQQAKPVCSCGHQLRGVAAIVLSKAKCPGFEPEVLEACCPAALTCDAKGMNIIMADGSPVFETDAELDGALHPG